LLSVETNLAETRSNLANSFLSLPIIRFFRLAIPGLSNDVASAYAAPFPDFQFRGGAAKWPLMVPLFQDDAVATHMSEAKQCLKAWNKHMLIMFSDKVSNLIPVTFNVQKRRQAL
jgi:hypothetical protein